MPLPGRLPDRSLGTSIPHPQKRFRGTGDERADDRIMTLNQAQEQALHTEGNVLLVAGAGTGKTRTLVERCVQCLLKETPPASIDEILMVTFTEAAAAEMRRRIRERLEEELK